MLEKTTAFLLVCVLCLAPLTLISSAKIEFDNTILTDSQINALPYDATISVPEGGTYGTALKYVGFNVVPPIHELTSDTALIVDYDTVSLGVNSPYYYYGVSNVTQLQYYRSANVARYAVSYYVVPTMCLKADILTLPKIYSVTKSSYPDVDIEVYCTIYDADRNVTDLSFNINPYVEMNDYTSVRYSNTAWRCTIDIGKAIYDALSQYDNNTLLSFTCFIEQLNFTQASGLITYLTDYTARIYNTTGNFLNDKFALTGYKPVGGFVSSALSGFHRVMSSEILPHLSLYTIFITATAIPTTIAILRRL